MERLPLSGQVFKEDISWTPNGHEKGIPARDSDLEIVREPALVESADGPQGLMLENEEFIESRNGARHLHADASGNFADTSFVDFVERRFIPEHVLLKRTSGRTHYHAILKHVLTPEEVDRVYHIDVEGSQGKLKTRPNWPYLSSIPLRDIRADHVQNLISAALETGYSTQTATHIRNVVSAVFSYAIKERYFIGANPAADVKLPGMKRKEKHTLTLAQVKQVLQVMQYPEKEMTLIAILTSMNVAEICGLQWKHVNLSNVSVDRGGEMVPARSIAVRKQWYRGELCSVTNGRTKNLTIPQVLLPTLSRLSNRGRCTGMDDYVLMSNAGTPINQMNVAARRLKSIGRDLQMPWLSWQVFRRTHVSLVREFGMQFLRQMAMVVQSDYVGTSADRASKAPALRLCDPPVRIHDR